VTAAGVVVGGVGVDGGGGSSSMAVVVVVVVVIPSYFNLVSGLAQV